MPAVYAAPEGQGLQVSELFVALYVLGAQAAQTESASSEQGVERELPGAQTVQGVHASAPAADQEPAAQVEQLLSFVGEQAALRKAPAAHVAVEQAAQGESPLALHVLPALQAGSGWHESEGSSQEELASQAHEVCPVAVPVT